MPKQSSRNPNPSQHCFVTPLRRSSRILQRESQDAKTHQLNLVNYCKTCPQEGASKSITESNRRAVIYSSPVSGLVKSGSLSNEGARPSVLRRSPRLSLVRNAEKRVVKLGCNKPDKRSDCKASEEKPKFDGVSAKSLDNGKALCLRRSSRLSFVRNADKLVVQGGCEEPENRSYCKSTESKKRLFTHSVKKSLVNERVLLKKVNGEVDGDTNVQKVDRRGKGGKGGSIGVKMVLGLKAVNRTDVSDTNEKARIGRKRKRREEAGKRSCAQGWTREQEMALQRAYLLVKPTPTFWKKVSKLVPGKSAHECFDKVNSDHATPPPHLPRSRADKIYSSTGGCFSVSASKLLKPSNLKNNKQKNTLAQRTLRQLLQKHNRIDQDYEADLFSVLEPDMDPPIQDTQLNEEPSTPRHLEDRGFLRRCQGSTSSEQKKPPRRFSGSHEKELVSPPVLKQVKNRVLHEKYIDLLHSREAKRNAACARARRCGKENKAQTNFQKIDTVRAAKDVLVSDARNAINHLQDLQANAMGNSSDFDDDCNDDEYENGP